MRGYLRTSVHNNLHFLYSIHCSFSTLEQVYLISCYFEFQPSFYVLYHHITARRLMDSNIKVGKLYVELINKPWENVCRIQTQFRIPLCKISTSRPNTETVNQQQNHQLHTMHTKTSLPNTQKPYNQTHKKTI